MLNQEIYDLTGMVEKAERSAEEQAALDRNNEIAMRGLTSWQESSGGCNE